MKINKREIVSRLVDIPSKSKRVFWQREMSLLKKLQEKFDSLEFWSKVQLPHKLDSLAILFSDYYLELINKKFLEFNYKIPKPQEEIQLSEAQEGDSLKLPKKRSSLKDFLS